MGSRPTHESLELTGERRETAGWVSSVPPAGIKTESSARDSGGVEGSKEGGDSARQEKTGERSASETVTTMSKPGPSTNPGPSDSPKDGLGVTKGLGNVTGSGDGVPAVVGGREDGTLAAEAGLGMRRGRKSEKTAGTEVQKLPGSAEVRPGSAAVSGREAGGRRAGSPWEGVTEGSVLDAIVAGAGRTRDERSRGDLGAIGIPGASMEARVNRIEEMISREVVRFRWTGQEAVSVLIRPEEGTEMMVHLRQRDGQLEAMLGMGRGEAARFGGHWQQLHDALAEQNVRLLPSREMSASLNPAGGGASLNGSPGSGPGHGSGHGSGWNPPSGGQSGSGLGMGMGMGTGAGTDWREGQGGATHDHTPDRRRGADGWPGEGEAARSRNATPAGRPGRGKPVANPEGWEFWA